MMELIAKVWAMMVLPLLLVGLLGFLAVRSTARVSRHGLSRWILLGVSLGSGIALALVLAPRALDVVLDNGPLLGLTMVPLIIMIAAAVWMIRVSTSKGVTAACMCLVLLCAGLTFVSAQYFAEMVMFERTISSALNGEIDPDAVGRIQWEARLNREDRLWLRDLPPTLDVECRTRLFPNGACCLVEYPDGRQSEIHIFRAGFRQYAVRKFTIPSYGMCRNPNFDPRAAPGSANSKEFVRCDRV